MPKPPVVKDDAAQTPSDLNPDAFVRLSLDNLQAWLKENWWELSPDDRNATQEVLRGVKQPRHLVEAYGYVATMERRYPNATRLPEHGLYARNSDD